MTLYHWVAAHTNIYGIILLSKSQSLNLPIGHIKPQYGMSDDIISSPMKFPLCVRVGVGVNISTSCPVHNSAGLPDGARVEVSSAFISHDIHWEREKNHKDGGCFKSPRENNALKYILPNCSLNPGSSLRQALTRLLASPELYCAAYPSPPRYLPLW